MAEIANTSWYRTGTVTLTSNSATVTGSNTYWAHAGINPGATFRVDEDFTPYEVLEVVSDTEITLRTVFKGLAGAGKTYSIDRNFQSTPLAMMAADIASVVNKYEAYIDAQTLTATGLSAYQIAVKNGFTGTEAQWLEALKGNNEWAKLDARTEVLTNNADLHNSIVRGKNLGTAPTAAQMAAIRAGTFDDMWSGDYWQNGNNVFKIAEFNYYFSSGSTWANESNNNPLRGTPHVTLISAGRLYDGNSEQLANWGSIPEGGYIATPHNEVIQTTGLKIVQDIFGDENILEHPRITSQAISNHTVTSTIKEMVKLDAIHACQFFGNHPDILDRDMFAEKQFALAVLAPRLCYRNWGMKQLRNLHKTAGMVFGDGYGSPGQMSPNSNGGRELFVTLTLG